MALAEFRLIDRYFASRTHERKDVALGIGDDAALLDVPAGMQLVAAIDGMVEGSHFPVGTDPSAVGHKVLAVNLSDLAAMGAEAAWATLFLSLPQADETVAEAFSQGFFGLAERYGVALVGGDTVRGPFTAVVQVQGFVPPGAALCRNGARPGDEIFVTGTLGDGGAGLALAQGRLQASGPDADFLRERLERPMPRLEVGLRLRGIASACIDLSDGLAADLTHILTRSRVGARIEVGQLPLSDTLMRCVPDLHPRLDLALFAGDDYELCFTVPPAAVPDLTAVANDGRCPLTRIGVIEGEPGLRLVDRDGGIYTGATPGFDHFA